MIAPTPQQDAPLWGLVAFAAAFLALAHLGGCAAARVQCPSWAMPDRVDTDTAASGAGSVHVGTSTLPPQGDGDARFSGTTSVDFRCKSPCPKGSLLEYSKSRDGSETLKCLPTPAAPATGSAR